MGGVMIVTHGGANSFEFVGRYRDTYAAATNENTALGRAGTDVLGNQHGVVGIIVGFTWFERADIMHFMAEFPDELDQVLLHVVACMVGADGYFHLCLLSHLLG